MWNWSENQINLVLIRHGATKSNLEHRYLGKTDESLSTEGRNELQKVGCKGCYPQVDYMFTSPMKRCIETAEVLYPGRNPIIIPEWKETDFGDFEGKDYMDLQGDTQYQEWIHSQGTLPFPGGESRESFAQRCDIGFYRMIDLISQQAEEGFCECKTVGMIVHGGTIMSLLSRYAGGDYFDYQIPNGGGYECTLRYASKGGKRSIKVTDVKKI